MVNVQPASLVDEIVDFYLKSGDYNGIPMSKLAEKFGVKPASLIGVIVDLVRSDRVSLPSPHQGHPHILMFDRPIDEQLQSLEGGGLATCLYPTSISVGERIDVAEYDDRPFSKLMVLGAPKLRALPFRLEILETYEGDPRYWYRFWDYGGTISVQEEHYRAMDESDRINMRFGVGHNERGERVVTAFLNDLGNLARLPARQQRIWWEYLVDGDCRMSEEYFKNTILAEWTDTMSFYQGVIYEQVEINKLFEAMGRAPLFRSTYEDGDRPRGFSFFIRPTKHNYDQFVHLMDKMLSDNIDIGSFGDDIDRYDRVHHDNGEVERVSKASITMLDEWLRDRYPDLADDERRKIIDPLRKVRTLRQRPAHKIGQNEYDEELYDKQEALVEEAHGGLKKLREVVSEDNDVSQYEPPSWEGRVTLRRY